MSRIPVGAGRATFLEVVALMLRSVGGTLIRI